MISEISGNVAHDWANALHIWAYSAFSEKCREIPITFHQTKLLERSAETAFWEIVLENAKL